MGFLYFLPGQKIVSREQLEAAGLGHALDGPSGPDCRETSAGPGGAGGTIVVPGDPAPGVERVACGYHKDRQTWRQAPGGAYWVGYYNDRRPGPADLLRRRTFDGTPVRMLDGNDWVVPRCVAPVPGREPGLPRGLDVGDDGAVILRPHPRYEKLCDLAFDFWLEFSGQGEAKLSADDEVRLAVEALACNYRVGRLEAIGVLRLWSTEELRLVLRAIVDADEVEAYLKSREPQAGEKKSATAPAPT